MFVLTRALFANNEILSLVSTEFERKEYLAKGITIQTHGEEPPEARGHQRLGTPRGAGPIATASVASA